MCVTGNIITLTDAGRQVIFSQPWPCTESDITPRIDGGQAEFAKVRAAPDAPCLHAHADVRTQRRPAT
ncbi:hypothetical protein XFF6992_240028 [Xanthomonas citri pv. fuscans]|nr:hypothetical protein XFF6992_240028 [Xanthomonas citri pv. fuscans]SOO34502.1 hypothetical protein XFF6994_4100004 [Xanthomonas citri pv. fuscans]